MVSDTIASSTFEEYEQGGAVVYVYTLQDGIKHGEWFGKSVELNFVFVRGQYANGVKCGMEYEYEYICHPQYRFDRVVCEIEYGMNGIETQRTENPVEWQPENDMF